MSIETDTQPGGKLYDEAVQKGAELARKVIDADGPLDFDAPEVATLQVLLQGLQHQAHIAQQVNRAMAEVLYRQGFQLIHRENPDGSVIFDLQNKPTDEPVTKH